MSPKVLYNVYIVRYGYPLLRIALGAFKATIANIIGPFLFPGFPLLYLYGKEEIFIRLTALGAYYIYGSWEWALIRGGRLFEAGHLLNIHHFQQVWHVYFATKQ